VPGEVRRQEMLDAARSVFADRGYQRASMDEIARSAGITKPMLYVHFDSKEGLFAAVAEAAGNELRERLEAVGLEAGIDPAERLWRGLLEVFDFVDQHREGWSVLYPLGDVPQGPIGAGAARARAATGALLAELFVHAAREEGIGPQAAGQLDAIGHAVTAATIAGASWWLHHPEEPKEIQALRLMNLLWMGLGDLIEGRMWVPSPS
jgi:AcrR family transcriptional regulator